MDPIGPDVQDGRRACRITVSHTCVDPSIDAQFTDCG